MKKYEKCLLIGTFLTFLGIFILYKIRWSLFIGWGIVIMGKLIILISILEYVDYRRAFRGEDLSQDPKFKKMLRKLRKEMNLLKRFPKQ